MKMNSECKTSLGVGTPKERKKARQGENFLTNEIHDNDDEADLRKFGTKHSKKILAAY